MKTFCQSSLALLFLSGCLLLLPAVNIAAQQKPSLAMIRADKTALTEELAQVFQDSLEGHFRFSDPELTQQVVYTGAAINAAGAALGNEKNLFNMSLPSARNMGIGIGCDYFLILRSENLRRSSFEKNAYYEAYFVAFLVNARTGNLLGWKTMSAEAAEALPANKTLISSFKEYVNDIPEILRAGVLAEQKNIFDTSVYEIADNSGEGLRTPLPYRRVSPASTPAAQHLRIEAVVDIEVAVDAKGYITQTRIFRWAGFGLDEAVTETVRKMNFRPAILDGKAIPARFLLRYNFRVPTLKTKNSTQM